MMGDQRQATVSHGMTAHCSAGSGPGEKLTGTARKSSVVKSVAQATAVAVGAQKIPCADARGSFLTCI